MVRSRPGLLERVIGEASYASGGVHDEDPSPSRLEADDQRVVMRRVDPVGDDDLDQHGKTSCQQPQDSRRVLPVQRAVDEDGVEPLVAKAVSDLPRSNRALLHGLGACGVAIPGFGDKTVVGEKRLHASQPAVAIASLSDLRHRKKDRIRGEVLPDRGLGKPTAAAARERK
jgi:hypothetical protein